MQPRNPRDARAALWIERLVWRAAAGAVLAVLILVLLWSVRWLDEVAPHPATATARPAERLQDEAYPDNPVDRDTTVIAELHRPRG